MGSFVGLVGLLIFGIAVFLLFLVLIIKFIKVAWDGSDSISQSGLKRVKSEARKLIDKKQIDDEERFCKIVVYLFKSSDPESINLLEELRELKAQN